jgi:hypothetical protein
MGFESAKGRLQPGGAGREVFCLREEEGLEIDLKEVFIMKIFRKAVSTCFVLAVLVVTATTGIGAVLDYTGTVEQKGEVVVLFTPDETYVLKGEDLLPDMIGKKVAVAGTVEEKGQVKVLTVVSFQEVEVK